MSNPRAEAIHLLGDDEAFWRWVDLNRQVPDGEPLPDIGPWEPLSAPINWWQIKRELAFGAHPFGDLLARAEDVTWDWPSA